MYRLFCDSNCELWHTMVEELGISVISMPYTLGTETKGYDMGKEHDFKAFFDAMRNKAVPTTSALNEYDYIEYFEPVLAAGEDILYITFSHKLSGTFAFMEKAIQTLREKYPARTIRAVDTKSISLGAGFIVYYAALQYKAGMGMDELVSYVEDLREHSATYFAVDDLVYLKRGGRISGMAAAMGTLIGIKPIIAIMQDGSLQSVQKVKGSKKVISALVDYIVKKGENVTDWKIMILQADASAAAEELSAKIREIYPEADILIQPVGPVIGAHCGPGTLGVVFHASER